MNTKHNNLKKIDLLSIVVPVYNSESSLKELYLRLDKTMKAHKMKYELIFVDDGSENKSTIDVLNELSVKESIRVIFLSRNFGQHAATLCGLHSSKGDFVITIDDDLQHPPEDIIKLLKFTNHDAVIASFAKKSHSLYRRTLSRIKGFFDYIIIGKPYQLQLSSFRLLSRFVVDNMNEIKTNYPFIPAQLFLVTKDVVNVQTTHSVRFTGKSNYNFIKLFKLFSNLLFNNSVFLLVALARIGLFCSLLSIFFGIFIIFKQLFWGVSVAGWTSIMVTIFFVGGLNLFGIGIVGEYLLRIVKGVENTPCYIIRKDTDNKTVENE